MGRYDTIGDLEADVPPALSRCSARSSRDNNPGDMVALHAVSKKLLRRLDVEEVRRGDHRAPQGPSRQACLGAAAAGARGRGRARGALQIRRRCDAVLDARDRAQLDVDASADLVVEDGLEVQSPSLEEVREQVRGLEVRRRRQGRLEITEVVGLEPGPEARMVQLDELRSRHRLRCVNHLWLTKRLNRTRARGV